MRDGYINIQLEAAKLGVAKSDPSLYINSPLRYIQAELYEKLKNHKFDTSNYIIINKDDTFQEVILKLKGLL